MPSLDYSVVSRDVAQMVNELTKRAGEPKGARAWTGHNAGIIVVFVIVFIIAVGLIALFIQKKLKERKAARPAKEETPAK
ncbi:MAG: hypothetical protein M1812_007433 [Candelaria pacifica]|nr:MAG: hypothetical protein M1812_007433 [Candelaria pacifica]